VATKFSDDGDTLQLTDNMIYWCEISESTPTLPPPGSVVSTQPWPGQKSSHCLPLGVSGPTAH